MTAKEKAIKLLDRFIQVNGNSFFAKQCALVAIDEICEAINWHELEVPNKEWNYWNDVKLEVERF